MTIKSYSEAISFKSNTAETEENVDFALKMKNAIDVQLIDTNLYMSKELWLPYGSRGAFGGQVRTLDVALPLPNHYIRSLLNH